jgi:hypothetical protein
LMEVTYCDDTGIWRTNFPPPADFDGDADYVFGDSYYERDLSSAEMAALQSNLAALNAPLLAAGEAARKAWFRVD